MLKKSLMSIFLTGKNCFGMEVNMINREHKDRLFSFLFGREENKKWTLELYNAINASHYTEPEKIEITNDRGCALYGDEERPFLYPALENEHLRTTVVMESEPPHPGADVCGQAV